MQAAVFVDVPCRRASKSAHPAGSKQHRTIHCGPYSEERSRKQRGRSAHRRLSIRYRHARQLNDHRRCHICHLSLSHVMVPRPQVQDDLCRSRSSPERKAVAPVLGQPPSKMQRLLESTDDGYDIVCTLINRDFLETLQARPGL